MPWASIHAVLTGGAGSLAKQGAATASFTFAWAAMRVVRVCDPGAALIAVLAQLRNPPPAAGSSAAVPRVALFLGGFFPLTAWPGFRGGLALGRGFELVGGGFRPSTRGLFEPHGLWDLRFGGYQDHPSGRPGITSDSMTRGARGALNT